MRNTLVWAATILLALALATLFVCDAEAQEVELSLRNELEAWPTPDRFYQNRTRLNAQALASWGAVHVRLRYARLMWGASDAKIEGSLLNAEAGKVNERRRGAAMYLQRSGVRVGWKVERRSVNHTWRHKRSREGRHPWFPGSYKIGQRAADGEQAPNHPPGLSRPSIGYWDGARPLVGLQRGGWELELAGPLVRWKSLTLAWATVTLDAAYRRGLWEVRLQAQALGPTGWAADLQVERVLLGPLSAGLRVGALDAPDWDDNLQRVALTLALDLEKGWDL